MDFTLREYIETLRSYKHLIVCYSNCPSLPYLVFITLIIVVFFLPDYLYMRLNFVSKNKRLLLNSNFLVPYKVNVPVDEQVLVSEHLSNFPLTFKTKASNFWIETVDFNTEYCIVYQALQILAKLFLSLSTFILLLAVRRLVHLPYTKETADTF